MYLFYNSNDVEILGRICPVASRQELRTTLFQWCVNKIYSEEKKWHKRKINTTTLSIF